MSDPAGPAEGDEEDRTPGSPVEEEQASEGPEAAGDDEAPVAADGADRGDDEQPAPAIDPSAWCIVAVADVTMELPRPYPEIVLHESQHPWRELHIPVGMPEGTAIAHALRGADTPRPLTHDLMSDVMVGHDISIAALRITVRRGQVYFAELDTTGPRGRRVVPCRPSDGIALVLRQPMPVPVLVAEWVFTGEDPPPGVADST